MMNSARMILMLSSILVLVACAAAGSLTVPSSASVCPDGMILCNGSCINNTIPCNQSCADGMTLCNGTCVDILTDTQNCGSCENVCSLGMVCSKGECSCLKGMVLCNNTCTDTSIDSKNCGTCGNVCSGKAICDDGRCIDQYANICIDGDCSSPIVVQRRNIDADNPGV